MNQREIYIAWWLRILGNCPYATSRFNLRWEQVWWQSQPISPRPKMLTGTAAPLYRRLCAGDHGGALWKTSFIRRSPREDGLRQWRCTSPLLAWIIGKWRRKTPKTNPGVACEMCLIPPPLRTEHVLFTAAGISWEFQLIRRFYGFYSSALMKKQH